MSPAPASAPYPSEPPADGTSLRKASPAVDHPMMGTLEKATTFAGHNRISTQALTSVAKVAAAEVLAVTPAHVRVSWSDDGGALALSVSSAMGAPSLQEVRRQPGLTARGGGSVLERATAAKARILAQVEYLTGSRLSRVDVRISGLVVRADGRVR